MSDLIHEMEVTQRQLKKAVKMLRETGTAYAKAERDYRVLLRTESLKLKSEGMAVGMIDMTCKGIPSVADARMNRTIAEVTYKANLESIQWLKLQIRILDNQISREWSVEMPV